MTTNDSEGVMRKFLDGLIIIGIVGLLLFLGWTAVMMPKIQGRIADKNLSACLAYCGNQPVTFFSDGKACECAHARGQDAGCGGPCMSEEYAVCRTALDLEHRAYDACLLREQSRGTVPLPDAGTGNTGPCRCVTLEGEPIDCSHGGAMPLPGLNPCLNLILDAGMKDAADAAARILRKIEKPKVEMLVRGCICGETWEGCEPYCADAGNHIHTWHPVEDLPILLDQVSIRLGLRPIEEEPGWETQICDGCYSIRRVRVP